MRILRSIAAIVGGFWFMAATVWVGTLVAARVFMPDGPRSGTAPGPMSAAYLVALLAASALGSLMGGWLAARIAPFAPFAHACVLAAIYVAMSVNLLIRQPDSSQLGPQFWLYAVATCVVGALGVLLGGRLRSAAAAAGGPVVA